MSLTRRDFLSSAAATGAAAAFGLSFASRAFAQDTADIRIAAIGFNGQGASHIRSLGSRIVALCDADEQVLERKAQELRRGGRTIDTYTDFRKLLERPDIDAVSIATPNHTHAWITVLALQAGKHVYVEKPASHNIWEGRQMVAAAKRYNRIVQIGTQCRSAGSLREAAEFVRAGNLGKVQYAIGTCYKPRQSIGKLDAPLVIPPNVHYDLWCGPAEKKDIVRPKLHYDWHWDWNTGNGDMGNQGIHQMDIARWFLGEPALAPRAISIGGRLGYEDAGNTPNTQTIFLDYPSAPLIFETRGLPRSQAGQANWGRSMDRYRGSTIGVIVQCEKGYVLIPSYTEAEAFDRNGNSIKRWRINGGEFEAHQANWLEAIVAGDPSRQHGPIQEGHVSSSLCHMGGISHQLGQVIRTAEIADRIKGNDLLSMSFDRMAAHLRANGIDLDGRGGVLVLGPWVELDPKTESFVGNDAANELRARKQRDGFTVPDVERDVLAAAAAG